MNKNYIGMALFSALLFGLSTPISKLFLKEINPILLASLYYLGAAVLLIPLSYKNFSREITYLKTNPKDLWRLLGAVIFGGILGPLALMYGIKLSNATTASLLLNLETVATALLAYFFFKEHIGKKVLISSILTITAGVILVVQGDFHLSVGGVLISLACLSWGFDNNFTATVEGVSPATNTIIKGMGAGIFNLCLAFILYEIEISPANILLALIVGFLSYGLSIVLYIMSARGLGASRSQIIFAANPFIGALASYLIFFEILDMKFFISLILMVIAMIVLYYENHGHEHFHEEIEHEHEHDHHDNHHDHSHSDLNPNIKHTHSHFHQEKRHTHPHYPDVHHRHKH